MNKNDIDVVLIGAGAMSTCLGMLLKELDPSLKIIMVERLDNVAKESTASLNNAGTGHAAYCELNYTAVAEDLPTDSNGDVTADEIDISKALTINEAFELSLQFWSYCVEKGSLPDPSRFINSVPHQSFVWGRENVDFLRKRYETMRKHPMFKEMEYTDDPEVIKEWMPLIMQNRHHSEKVAATRIKHGSDVNFGRIARAFARYLREQPDFDLRLNVNVSDLEKQSDGRWKVMIQDLNLENRNPIYTKFVFLGLGGGALPLLQKSDIPEADGYGGFPVSGQWLVCRKPDIVKKHHAKVYGKAAVGSPPMSVPHLDSRVLEDGNALLFGPFAGFTTKFLKHGSNFDLIKSTTFNNILPLSVAGFKNFDLTKYLIKESRKTHEERMASLRDYFPDAKDDDWVFAEAGQRVQIIKKDKDEVGKLEFGTEVVSSADGSLAALLGASPGASVAVKAMLEVLQKCFVREMQTPEWKAKLEEMIPSYGKSLINDPELLRTVRSRTLKTLNLGELDDDPKEFEGLYTLSRSYISSKQYSEAIEPLVKCLELKPDSVKAMLSLADALAISSNSKLVGRPRELLNKALTIEPNNVTALWLSGMAASQEQEYLEAVSKWTTLLPLLSSRPNDSKTVSNLINNAKKRLTPAQLASLEESS